MRNLIAVLMFALAGNAFGQTGVYYEYSSNRPGEQGLDSSLYMKEYFKDGLLIQRERPQSVMHTERYHYRNDLRTEVDLLAGNRSAHYRCLFEDDAPILMHSQDGFACQLPDKVTFRYDSLQREVERKYLFPTDSCNYSIRTQHYGDSIQVKTYLDHRNQPSDVEEWKFDEKGLYLIIKRRVSASSAHAWVRRLDFP